MKFLVTFFKLRVLCITNTLVSWRQSRYAAVKVGIRRGDCRYGGHI